MTEVLCPKCYKNTRTLANQMAMGGDMMLVECLECGRVFEVSIKIRLFKLKNDKVKEESE